MSKQGKFEKLEDGSVIYHPRIKKGKYKAGAFSTCVMEYEPVSEETIKKIQEEFYASVDQNKAFKTPIILDKPLTMYEAFEMMHKQDGTTDGRPKCDFAL